MLLKGDRHVDEPDCSCLSSYPQEALLPSPFVQSRRWVESEGGCANPADPHHTEDTDTSEERPGKTADESEPTLLNQNHTQKSCFSLLLMLRFVSETRPDVRVPEFGC